MKMALARFRNDPKAEMSFDVERLLASFERITGKSFGEIPMNPVLVSDTRVIAVNVKRYRELLGTWTAWWAWEPKK